MITKAEIYLIGLIVMAASLAGMWFFAKHEGRIEEQTIWENKQAAATKADLDSLTQAIGMSNQIAQDTQEALKKGKAKSIIDRGVIEREIRTDVRYVNDCFPDTGRLRWNAISAGNPLVPDSTAGSGTGGGVPAGVGPTSPGLQRGNTPPQSPSSAGGIRQLPSK